MTKKGDNNIEPCRTSEYFKQLRNFFYPQKLSIVTTIFVFLAK